MATFLTLLKVSLFASVVAFGLYVSYLSAKIFGHLKPDANRLKIISLRRVPKIEELEESGHKLRKRFFICLFLLVVYMALVALVLSI
jgi:hypothetical protein